MTLSESSASPKESFAPARFLLKTIADLRLAIVLLLLIAIFSISGTVIEQGEILAFNGPIVVHAAMIIILIRAIWGP